MLFHLPATVAELLNEGLMRLLVVEDEARITEVLRAALSRAGFAVDAVGTMADARAALPLAPYDAIILDLGLPDGDGLDLLTEDVLTCRDIGRVAAKRIDPRLILGGHARPQQ